MYDGLGLVLDGVQLHGQELKHGMVLRRGQEQVIV